MIEFLIGAGLFIFFVIINPRDIIELFTAPNPEKDKEINELRRQNAARYISMIELHQKLSEYRKEGENG